MSLSQNMTSLTQNCIEQETVILIWCNSTQLDINVKTNSLPLPENTWIKPCSRKSIGHSAREPFLFLELILCQRNSSSLEKKNQVIVKFKCQNKDNVIFNCKSLKDKSADVTQLKYLCNFLISDIISQENHQVTYRHHLLKTAGKIHPTWFFNNIGNLKSTNNSSVYKLSQTDGIDNLFRVVNLEEFVNSASFLFLLLFVKVLLLFLL